MVHHPGFVSRLILPLATWGGTGYLPVAPGTWATVATLPLWWLLTHLGLLGYALAWTGLLVVAVVVAGPAQSLLGRVDHSAIVIDEAVGLLVALAGVPLRWPWILTGVLLFRVLDIVKPWPANWFNRGTTGLDVVMDDVVAGVMARVVLGLLMIVFGRYGSS